jgi:hypothetical protein
MKKWLIILSVLIILALACIYFFIPATLNISQVTLVRSAKSSAYRFLSEKNNWRKWWPGDSSQKNNSFYYKNVRYQMQPKLRTTVDVLIQQGDSGINSTIDIIPLSNDSIGIQWQCSIASGLNPVRKIMNYNEAVAIKKNMDDILEHFQVFIENLDNVYGIHIEQSSTKDTLLICTKSRMTKYPTSADTYNLINKLRKHIISYGAKQTGYPMRNITQLDSGGFQIMVALPIDKELKTENIFFPSRMVPGRFLVAEVKGGPGTVDEAQKQIRLYMQEYKRMSLAIPFESLITDRSIETDTSKWVTKLFNPVL